MTSEYNINDFREKLIELTKEGYPMIKGNPFAILSMNFSDKPFYGNIYDKNFKITKNANIGVLPYLITGTFKKNGNLTKVDYTIIPMKFGYYWIRFFPILINIIALLVVIINWKDINFEILNSKFLFFVFFAELILLLPIVITEIRLKKFEKKFIKIMKINSNYR